jgi:hypothetical protein
VPNVKEAGLRPDRLRWDDGAYTMQGVVKALGVTKGTVHTWLKEGLMKGQSLGPSMLWRSDLTPDQRHAFRWRADQHRRTPRRHAEPSNDSQSKTSSKAPKKHVSVTGRQEMGTIDCRSTMRAGTLTRHRGDRGHGNPCSEKGHRNLADHCITCIAVTNDEVSYPTRRYYAAIENRVNVVQWPCI